MANLTLASVFFLAPTQAPIAPNNAFIGGLGAARVALDFNLMGRDPFPGIPRGRVSGTVKEHASPSDLPRKRLVYLHRQRDGRRVGAMASDPTTGAYEFRDIDTREQYFVAAFDYTLNYNAVIRSDVTPEMIA